MTLSHKCAGKDVSAPLSSKLTDKSATSLAVGQMLIQHRADGEVFRPESLLWLCGNLPRSHRDPKPVEGLRSDQFGTCFRLLSKSRNWDVPALGSGHQFRGPAAGGRQDGRFAPG